MPSKVDKFVSFATSEDAQKIGSSALNFLKNTGLARKGLQKIQDKVSKKTNPKHPKLHQFTKNTLDKLIGAATPAKEVGIGTAALDFAKDSGLGAKALDKINTKIHDKTKNNPGLDTLRRIAASEANKAIPFSSQNVSNEAPKEYNYLRNLIAPSAGSALTGALGQPLKKYGLAY